MGLCSSAMIIICLAAAYPSAAQVARASSVKYPEWGFSIEAPAAAKRSDLPPSPGTSLGEAFVSGGRAFVVKVLTTPPDSLASTAIEQSLQAQYKQSQNSGGRRWELLLNNDDVFKGLSRTIPLTPDEAKKAPFLVEIAKDGKIRESMCYSPLGDEAAAILAVGVMGPVGQEQQIETDAMAFAHSVKRIPMKAKEPPVAKPAPSKPVPPVTKPAPPKPEPVAPKRPANALMSLAPGQIEVIGRVEAVSPDGRTLTLSADSIRMPGQKPIPLERPRTKVVRLKKPDPLAGVGSRVSAIGVNEGVGSSLSAEMLEILKASSASKPM